MDPVVGLKPPYRWKSNGASPKPLLQIRGTRTREGEARGRRRRRKPLLNLFLDPSLGGVSLELDAVAGKSMSSVATGLLSEPPPLWIVVSDGRAGIMCTELLMVAVDVDGAEPVANTGLRGRGSLSSSSSFLPPSSSFSFFLLKIFMEKLEALPWW
jgi:hypothetical protein